MPQSLPIVYSPVHYIEHQYMTPKVRLNNAVTFQIDNISLVTTIHASGTHHVECNRCLEDIPLTKMAHVSNLIL
jgi:uncharacterized metal-binding protein YceD (DUF177 family)